MGRWEEGPQVLKAKRVRTIPNLNKAGSSAAATRSTVGGFLWLLHTQEFIFPLG